MFLFGKKNKNAVPGSRIYVCHTYFHVYVSMLREYSLPVEQQGKAKIVLSSVFQDFESLKDRLAACPLWDEVLELYEKNYTDFPELV